MEILLWLLPAAVVTLAAMAWVAWWGREPRGKDATDREAAARRLGEALARGREKQARFVRERRVDERSTGVALRPSRVRPVVIPGEAEPVVAEAGGSAVAEPVQGAVHESVQEKDRRAS